MSKSDLGIRPTCINDSCEKRFSVYGQTLSKQEFLYLEKLVVDVTVPKLQTTEG